MTHATQEVPQRAAQKDGREGPGPDEIQPAANERLDRFLTGFITVAPFIGLGVAAWQVWGGALRTGDLIVFGIMYLVSVLGVTVGFHRLFTHRAFATSRPVRVMLGILGSVAIEGPVISWVADHRKHHAYSDVEGDPHSPHVDHGGGIAGALRGLFHAHLGWLFIHTQRAAKRRFAPDLFADSAMRFVDRTFFLWVAVGLAIPFGLGVAISGNIRGGLTGLLWGGLVRMLVVHHVTYSINSLCHYFGRKRFETGDESRNLAWLSMLSCGEAWHNNHHAFPTSARHGLRWWELDLSAGVIWLMERCGLVWDVVRISPERQRNKLAAAGAGIPPGA